MSLVKATPLLRISVSAEMPAPSLQAHEKVNKIKDKEKDKDRELEAPRLCSTEVETVVAHLASVAVAEWAVEWETATTPLEKVKEREPAPTPLDQVAASPVAT